LSETRRNLSESDRLPPMTHYVLGLLRQAPSAPKRTEEEAATLQEAHLGHLRRLRETGELIAVGPVEEEGVLRGILVFGTDDLSRARELMRTDPLVGGGFLILDLYTWFAPAGLTVSSSPGATTNLTFESD
jgi:uncharacterized protein